MKIGVFIFITCFIQDIMAQQFFEITLLDKATHEPIEGVSVLAKDKLINKYYFSNQAGRVRVNLNREGEVCFSHINYKTLWLSADALQESKPENIYLTKKDFALTEIVIKADKIDLYDIVQKLLVNTRKVKRKKTAQFQYELTTLYDSLLLEKSDGILLGHISLAKGMEDLDFVTGRYCMVESQPFFNLSFLQTLKFNSLFKRNKNDKIISPLNYKTIDRGNATIESLACGFCENNQRLLQITPKSQAHATVKILFDIKQFEVEQITLAENNSKVMLPISPDHAIENLRFNINYKVHQNTLQYVNVYYTMNYLLNGKHYDSISVNLVLKPANKDNTLKVFHFGDYQFKEDYEKLITYPLSMAYLEEEYHRTDAALLRSSYEKMTRHATLDKNYMLSILQRIRDYPMQIWDTTFCNCKIYNLMAPTEGQSEDLLLKNATVFSFNWIFMKKTTQDGIFFESSATFVDVKKSILFSADNKHSLLFYNLMFDYAEIMRRQTLQKLSKTIESDRENELIIQRAYNKTRDDIQRWAFNSRYGTKLSALAELNDLVKTELNKDNFAAYYRLQPDHVAGDPKLVYADLLAIFGEYEKAIEHYSGLLEESELTEEERLNIIYNRMQCYSKLQKQDELCADVRYLIARNFQGLGKSYLTLCKL